MMEVISNNHLTEICGGMCSQRVTNILGVACGATATFGSAVAKAVVQYQANIIKDNAEATKDKIQNAGTMSMAIILAAGTLCTTMTSAVAAMLPKCTDEP